MWVADVRLGTPNLGKFISRRNINESRRKMYVCARSWDGLSRRVSRFERLRRARHSRLTFDRVLVCVERAHRDFVTEITRRLRAV